MAVHRDLTGDSAALTAQAAARALSAARTAQTASIGSVAIRNNDGTRTTIGAQASGGGGIDLGGTGDVTWTADGVRKSARQLQVQLSQVQKQLDAGGGVSTPSRRNTVSVQEPPSDLTGLADGAYWSQVVSATDMTVKRVWKLVDRKWVEQDVSGSTLVAPTIDAGLISVASLAAKMIVSGEMWSSGTNPRFGITQDGFLGYDANGNETVHIDGADNRITGRASVGGMTIRHWDHENDTEGTSAIFRDSEGVGVDSPESELQKHQAISFVSGNQIASYEGAGSTSSNEYLSDAVRTIVHSSADNDWQSALTQQPGAVTMRVTPAGKAPAYPWEVQPAQDSSSSALYVGKTRVLLRAGDTGDPSKGKGSWLRLNSTSGAYLYSNFASDKSNSGFGETRLAFEQDGSAYLVADPDALSGTVTSGRFAGIIIEPNSSRSGKAFLHLCGILGRNKPSSMITYGSFEQGGIGYGSVHYRTIALPDYASSASVWRVFTMPYSYDGGIPQTFVSSTTSNQVTIAVRQLAEGSHTCGCWWIAFRVKK